MREGQPQPVLPKQPLRAIHDAHALKDRSKETEGMRLSGVTSKEFGVISGEVEGAVGFLKIHYKDQIEKRYDSFSDYFAGKVTREEVDDAFDSGARLFFLQQYRMYKKESPEMVQEMKDPEYTVNNIAAYFSDFTRTLKVARQYNLEPQTAVRLASLSYHHNPDTLVRLRREYNLPSVIINRALIHSPRDPDEFLQGVRDRADALTKQFPDVLPHIITAVAANHIADAEGFMQKVVDAKSTLQKEVEENPDAFPDITATMVSDFSMQNPATAKNKIVSVQQKITELKNDPRFLDVSPYVISTAVTGYGSDPEAFLKGVQEKIEALTAKFPTIRPSAIELAAAQHSASTEAFLQGVESTIATLQKQFPTVDAGIIVDAAVNHPHNSKKYVEITTAHMDELVVKYPGVNRALLAIAASSVNPEETLKKATEDLQKIDESFGQAFEPWLKLKAVRSYADPVGFLQGVLDDMPELSKQYPAYKEEQIKIARVQSPKHPEKYLRRIKVTA